MAVDKNKAMVKYLQSCPALANFLLYFNFGVAADNNKQIITNSTDVNTNEQYVNGSVKKEYSATIVDFKSVGYNAIISVDNPEYEDENISEMYETQGIIDWITEQNKLRNFPNFGEDCLVDEISSTIENPSIEGVDNSVTPAIAQYKVTIKVTYIDNSKVVWK